LPLIANSRLIQSEGDEPRKANEHENLGYLIARDLRDGLQLTIDLKILSSQEKLRDLRNLAERKERLDWDVFIYGWSGQIADAPPLELHYQIIGKHGALRRGGETPAFGRSL